MGHLIVLCYSHFGLYCTRHYNGVLNFEMTYHRAEMEKLEQSFRTLNYDLVEESSLLVCNFVKLFMTSTFALWLTILFERCNICTSLSKNTHRGNISKIHSFTTICNLACQNQDSKR